MECLADGLYAAAGVAEAGILASLMLELLAQPTLAKMVLGGSIFVSLMLIMTGLVQNYIEEACRAS